MDEKPIVELAAWRAKARADLRRPWFWVFLACLYAIVFLAVALLKFVLGLIVPHLPWISKPYVDPDPPSLITAFYCANLVLGFILLIIPVLYILGPKRRIPFLSGRKNADKTKT
jgi:uncharacterized BrkB/YihY/UPF0761 family membrane protein